LDYHIHQAQLRLRESFEEWQDWKEKEIKEFFPPK